MCKILVQGEQEPQSSEAKSRLVNFSDFLTVPYLAKVQIKQLLFFLLCLSSVVVPHTAVAQFEEGNRRVKSELIADHESLQPVDSYDVAASRIAVKLTIEDGWHLYWKNSGEAALPTSIRWTLPDGWRVGELQWPVPKKFLERGDVVTYGYNKEVLLIADLYAPIVIPEENENVEIKAEVSFLVCHDICVPGRNEVKLWLPFSTDKPLTPSKEYGLFEKTSKEVPQIPERLSGVISGLKVQSVFKENEILMSLSGLSKLGQPNVNLEIQVFPLLTDNTLFKDAKLIGQEENALLLSLPLDVQGQLPSKISAVIALSEKLTGESNPKGVEVITSTAASKDLKINSQFDSIARLKVPQALKYREFDFSNGPEVSQATTAKVNRQLWVILLFAFIAGIILNLMPCVLPILSIKVMAILIKADQSRSYVLRSAAVYSLGIISSLITLAVMIISLRSFGKELGWGFQFQHAEFVLALTVIVFVLALGFFDLYHFSLPFMQAANRAAGKIQTPMLKHFFDGVLMTVLSTPCTAPFLGTVLVFALTEPPMITLLVFVFIGLGLSFPYYYIATHPKFIKMLPKPGAWMFRVREIMGFLLLGTVIWLLFILSKLTEDGVVWTLISMLFCYFYFWLRKIVEQSKLNDHAKRSWKLAGLLVVVISVAVVFPKIVAPRNSASSYETDLISWQPYSEELVDTALANGQIAFIDFTADWCITCKANEKLALQTEIVANSIKTLNIAAFKADWTTGDERITSSLNKYGAKGVPHYVIIKEGEETTVLPTLLTPNTVVEALANAVKKN